MSIDHVTHAFNELNRAMGMPPLVPGHSHRKDGEVCRRLTNDMDALGQAGMDADVRPPAFEDNAADCSTRAGLAAARVISAEEREQRLVGVILAELIPDTYGNEVSRKQHAARIARAVVAAEGGRP